MNVPSGSLSTGGLSLEAVAGKAALAIATPVVKTLAQKLHLRPAPGGLIVRLDSVVGDPGYAVIVDNAAAVARRALAAGVAPRDAVSYFEYRRRRGRLELLEDRPFMNASIYTRDGAWLPSGLRSWLLVGEHEDPFSESHERMRRVGYVPWVAVDALGVVFGSTTRSFASSDLPPDYCRCGDERYAHVERERRGRLTRGAFGRCSVCSCRHYRFDSSKNADCGPSRTTPIPTSGAAVNVIERQRHVEGLKCSVTPIRKNGAWGMTCYLWNDGEATLTNVVVVADACSAERQDQAQATSVLGVLHPGDRKMLEFGPFPAAAEPTLLDFAPDQAVALYCTDVRGVNWYRSGTYLEVRRTPGPASQ